MIQEDGDGVTLDGALDEMRGWNRIVSGEEGAERGFAAAIQVLRDASGVAYAKGDDREAASLRAHAELLSKSPRWTEFKQAAEEAYQKYEHWHQVATELESAQ